MTISYPLAHPTTPGFQRFSLSHTSVVGKVRSPFTLVTQVQEYQGQAWLADVTLPFLTRAQAEPWHAWLLALNGSVGTFLLGDPLATLPQGAATGTPLVNGGSQTGKILVTDGWNPSVTNILKAGDYIQIANRLYKIMQDVSSDGSGNASLDIFPRLRESPADNTSIVTVSPKGLFRLINNTNTVINSDEGQLYSFSFQAEEAI